MDLGETAPHRQLNFGLARMHHEMGEHRDFLPDFIARLQLYGAHVLLEEGYGSGMGYSQQDYLRSNNLIRFSPLEEVFEQDYVLVLRCPPDRQIRLIRPGACLISMIHFPRDPYEWSCCRSLELEAISLDSIKDDTGRRLVENLRAVAWNESKRPLICWQSFIPSRGLSHPLAHLFALRCWVQGQSGFKLCRQPRDTAILFCIVAWQKRAFLGFR